MVKVVRWAGEEGPTAGAIDEIMRAEGLLPSSWSNGPGDRYGVHDHAYHKVLYCVRGSIRFVLPDDGEAAGVDLGPGDRMELPAGMRHGAIVGLHGCQCIEAPRMDFAASTRLDSARH
jgi:uncharacterized protein YjlB